MFFLHCSGLRCGAVIADFYFTMQFTNHAFVSPPLLFYQAFNPVFCRLFCSQTPYRRSCVRPPQPMAAGATHTRRHAAYCSQLTQHIPPASFLLCCSPVSIYSLGAHPAFNKYLQRRQCLFVATWPQSRENDLSQLPSYYIIERARAAT